MLAEACSVRRQPNTPPTPPAFAILEYSPGYSSTAEITDADHWADHFTDAMVDSQLWRLYLSKLSAFSYSGVSRGLANVARRYPLQTDILISTGRVLGGFLAAAIVGISLEVATGTFESIDGLFKLLVDYLSLSGLGKAVRRVC